jgi:hypothetical protein
LAEKKVSLIGAELVLSRASRPRCNDYPRASRSIQNFVGDYFAKKKLWVDLGGVVVVGEGAAGVEIGAEGLLFSAAVYYKKCHEKITRKIYCN